MISNKVSSGKENYNYLNGCKDGDDDFEMKSFYILFSQTKACIKP